MRDLRHVNEAVTLARLGPAIVHKDFALLAGSRKSYCVEEPGDVLGTSDLLEVEAAHGLERKADHQQRDEDEPDVKQPHFA